ncbi:hypothetical protein EZJ43_16835 [Pedobacter changchengzhani]|uniref:Uncharacterized protein n=1 Tax=Pedobacter changchengzhani TaxID=2529274 RepID=A0A4R5MI64_9SPHI|nr:hypothetical protein [Pedobacter changchengzhani]TDG34785.1 hypothetical protein EZJ43_16835 [Pedobacter changchengzhani]
MKTIICYLSIVLFTATFAKAQVAVGKTSVTNTSVSLEFGVSDATNGYKGLVLPWVTSAAAVTGAVDGTFIFDLTDHKVKYRKSGAWVDLSVDITGTANATSVSTQAGLTEDITKKAVIGVNPSDTTPGILVLADNDKAMVLPKVASPYLNLKNPTAGTMVYDTTSRQLAVFNGTVWSFWKP